MLGRSLKTGEQGEKEIKVKGTNKEEKKKKPSELEDRL